MKHLCLISVTLMLVGCQGQDGAPSTPLGTQEASPAPELREKTWPVPVLLCKPGTEIEITGSCLGANTERAKNLAYEISQFPLRKGAWNSIWLDLKSFVRRHALTDTEVACLKTNFCFMGAPQ